jgi:hypothetical protein
MIVGFFASAFGIVIKQQYIGTKLGANAMDEAARAAVPFLETPLLWIHVNPFITGQILTFVAIVLAASSYVLVSLFGPRREHDLDKLLHRGAYEVEDDAVLEKTRHAPWLEKLGFDPEFTGRDKWITLVTIAWPLVWTLIFVVGTLYNFSVDVPAETWLAWWHGWIWFTFGTGCVIMMWFSIGGFRDLRALFRHLRSVAIHRQNGPN